MGIPPFALTSTGKISPVTMIASASEDVNPESSSGPLLYQFVLDPPSNGRKGIESPLADVDAGQLVEAFEILDDVVRVSGPSGRRPGRRLCGITWPGSPRPEGRHIYSSCKATGHLRPWRTRFHSCAWRPAPPACPPGCVNCRTPLCPRLKPCADSLTCRQKTANRAVERHSSGPTCGQSCRPWSGTSARIGLFGGQRILEGKTPVRNLC